jgi:DNA replication protein DnaC
MGLNASRSQLKRNPKYFVSKCNEICPGFVVREETKEILNQLYLYAHGEGKLDPNKGIFFYGSVGTGKSTLMKILAEYQRILGNGFKCINCAELAGKFATYGLDSLNSSTYNEGDRGFDPVERGFDELGREPSPAKHYGNEVNIMQHILQIRYDLRIKTHVTTNLMIEELEQRYGVHIYDRLFEMFNFLEITGESFRR